MTKKQAYKILINTPIRCKENHTEYSKALHIALGALAKQMPKECITHKNNLLVVHCPTCNREFGIYIGQLTPYCPDCGQALMFGGDIDG